MIQVLRQIHDKYILQKDLSQTDYNNILALILTECKIPFPVETFEYFANSGIINELIRDSYNSKTTNAEKNSFINEIQTLLDFFIPSQTTKEIKLRILGHKSYYPLKPIRRGAVRYEVFNSRPILITVNNKKSESEYRNDSWLYWISRNELKFATSIILSAPIRNFFPYFLPYDTIDLDYSIVEQIPDNEIPLFLYQWLDIKNYFIPPNGEMFNREPRPDPSLYKFYSYDVLNSGFTEYFDSFSIRNHLLLRTSNYLLKALMHRPNLLFQEESLLQSFFALEGGLHLLQKKYGEESTRLNRNHLRKIFQYEITYLNDGESTFKFIEEGYFTRISLVHPEPDWGAEWNPYSHIGDFREYHGLARLVISWVLCEKPIEEY